jgi:hypothetical protein
MVCTRPRDAIPCEESPMYYDLNMEMGKIPEESEDNQQTEIVKHNKVKKTNRPLRKQNLVQNLLEAEMTNIDEQLEDMGDVAEEVVPVLHLETKPNVEDVKDEIDEAESRIVEERSFKGRKFRRGGFRFKADVL